MFSHLLFAWMPGRSDSARWTAFQMAPVLLLGGILLAGGVPQNAAAQEFGRPNNIETNAAYFFYGQPGEATIQVSLLGVRASGIYEVPDSTDLRTVLSLAGGMDLRPRSDNQKRPKVTIRLHRNGQMGTDPVFEALLREILRGEREVPMLRENDTIMVDVVQPSEFTFSQGLSIVSTLASVALLIARIVD